MPPRPTKQPAQRPKFPASLRVGPFDWTLRYWTKAELEGVNEGYLGQCFKNKLRICLRPGTVVAKEAEVVIHEVFHAIFDVSGLDRVDNTPEEVAVNHMGYGWLQVLRDNPALYAYLIAAANHKET